MSITAHVVEIKSVEDFLKILEAIKTPPKQPTQEEAILEAMKTAPSAVVTVVCVFNKETRKRLRSEIEVEYTNTPPSFGGIKRRRSTISAEEYPDHAEFVKAQTAEIESLVKVAGIQYSSVNGSQRFE